MALNTVSMQLNAFTYGHSALNHTLNINIKSAFLVEVHEISNVFKVGVKISSLILVYVTFLPLSFSQISVMYNNLPKT